MVKKPTRLLEANPKHVGWMNYSSMQNGAKFNDKNARLEKCKTLSIWEEALQVSVDGLRSANDFRLAVIFLAHEKHIHDFIHDFIWRSRDAQTLSELLGFQFRGAYLPWSTQPRLHHSCLSPWLIWTSAWSSSAAPCHCKRWMHQRYDLRGNSSVSVQRNMPI